MFYFRFGRRVSRAQTTNDTSEAQRKNRRHYESHDVRVLMSRVRFRYQGRIAVGQGAKEPAYICANDETKESSEVSHQMIRRG